jgi:hypothetical protein
LWVYVCERPFPTPSHFSRLFGESPQRSGLIIPGCGSHSSIQPQLTHFPMQILSFSLSLSHLMEISELFSPARVNITGHQVSPICQLLPAHDLLCRGHIRKGGVITGQSAVQKLSTLEKRKKNKKNQNVFHSLLSLSLSPC